MAPYFKKQNRQSASVYVSVKAEQISEFLLLSVWKHAINMSTLSNLRLTGIHQYIIYT